MKPEEQIDPAHQAIRGVLRVVGLMMIVVGVVLVATGMISLLSGFGSPMGTDGFGGVNGPMGMRGPGGFAAFFFGIPVLGIGIAITRFAFMGAAARYVAGEIAPVATDTLNSLAEEAGEGIEAVAHAIRDGVSGGTDSRTEPQVVCPKCAAGNRHGARFCSNCGAALTKTCPSCGAGNDAGAKFCDKCGAALG